jgi:phosphoribosylcarboxyaminoimidazole (NCAIR) mutase
VANISKSCTLNGEDSLLTIMRMTHRCAGATFVINGAINAGF